MYKNIMKVIDNAIAEKELVIQYYRDKEKEYKQEIETLKNEIELLKKYKPLQGENSHVCTR